MRIAFWSILFSVLSVQSLQAQFAVQPMIYQISTPPRKLLQTELVMQNLGQDETKYFRVSTVDLGQLDSGTWDPLDANDPLDRARLNELASGQSCKDWIRLNGLADPQGVLIGVPILGSQSIQLEMWVPPEARGFYSAGLVASLQGREGETGVAVRYDFIIPILITIEGAVLPKRIGLIGAGLELAEASDEGPARTLVTLGVENTGKTFARVVGAAQLTQVLPSGKNRLVKKGIVFDPVPIIPGSRLNLREDIFQDLPSGRYGVKAVLYVDGKPDESIQQEIDYVGSRASGLAHRDAAMRIDPPMLEIEAAPGRAKSAIVTVYNNADEEVTIKSYARVPKVLANRTFADQRLDDLSCAEWITVRPSEFTLRGFSKRNLRISFRMPERADLPKWSFSPGAYYGDLSLFGFYGDGSLAGQADTTVCVMDSTVRATAMVSDRGIKIESTGPSKVDVVATFENRSLVHVQPKCMLNLFPLESADASVRPVASTRLENSQVGNAFMLPLERRDFAAELDFTNSIAGRYRLEATLAFGESPDVQTVVQSKAIEIYVKADGVERAVLIP